MNTKEKIFPKTKDMNNLMFDNEGLYSISKPFDADQISTIIKEYCKFNDKIIDLTAGLGGNLLSFAKHFKSVIGVEIDKSRFDLLKNNIKCYDFKNIEIINDDCINHLKKEADIYFLDPPWGGPNYKKMKNLELFLGENSLGEIIELLPKNKLIVLKLPFNYDINLLKKYEILIKKIRNMLIILLKKS